ncbi:MAG: sigma-70 family RNA polymerase sigma factor [Kineosporiaceae bacterium]
MSVQPLPPVVREPAAEPFEQPGDEPFDQPAADLEVATVLAAQGGDARALASLLDDYLPLVRGIAGRALSADGDLAALDDVVQDVMVRVVANLGTLRDPSCLRSWLVAITMRQVRDRRRGRRRAGARLVPLDDAVHVQDPGADPRHTGEARWALARQVREVCDAVGLLADADRAVLRAWALERRGAIDRAELAHRLGITLGHAAVRVLRSRARLDDARRVARAARRHGCPTLVAILDQPSPTLLQRARRHVGACPACVLDPDDSLPAEVLLCTRSVEAALWRPRPSSWSSAQPVRTAQPVRLPGRPGAPGAAGSARAEAGHARGGQGGVVVHPLPRRGQGC